MDHENEAVTRTIEVPYNAAVLILDAAGTLRLDLNPEDVNAQVPRRHVMLVAALGQCVSKRPGWVVEAVEWAMEESSKHQAGGQE